MLFKIHLAMWYNAKRKGNTFSKSLNGWASNGWVSKVNVTSSLSNSFWIITLPLETVTDVQASHSLL